MRGRTRHNSFWPAHTHTFSSHIHIFSRIHTYIHLSHTYILLSHTYIFTLAYTYILLSHIYILLSHTYIFLSHTYTLTRTYILLENTDMCVKTTADCFPVAVQRRFNEDQGLIDAHFKLGSCDFGVNCNCSAHRPTYHYKTDPADTTTSLTELTNMLLSGSQSCLLDSLK